MRARLAVAFLLVVATAVESQPAAEPATGSIRGRVEIRRELPPSEPRPGVADLGFAVNPRDVPDRRRSVVYLEVAPSGAFGEPPSPPAVLDQRNESFVPFVLAIPVGTTVEFPNHDRTYHNVFSFSKTRRFDLGRYGRGESKSIRFDQPGVVRVFCEIHSHMSAFILVFAHRYFTVTDAEGRYHIDGVPPGSYTVAAWNDGEVRDTRPVKVPEGGAVELDFVVR
jgi:plastocyanin